MIKTERQYRITKSQAKEFKDAISELVPAKLPQGSDPVLVDVQRKALRSQHAELQGQLEKYKNLVDGRIRSFSASSLAELPNLLIKARIASGTQRDLAERLKVKEQQVQRWEITDYKGVSLENLVLIAAALNVRVKLSFKLPPLPKLKAH